MKKINNVRAWFSIIIIVLLVIFSMIDRNAINLMVDPIRKSFGINDFQISLLQGPAFAVFFLIGSLLMGWMIDKYSNTLLIYIGVTIWSLATIASGFSSSFMLLLISRCFVGLGESVLQPAGWNIVTKLFPPHKLATAIGMLTAGSQVGVAISFLLTGFMVSEANQFSSFFGGLEPWQLVFVAAGVPGLILAFLVFFIQAEKNKEKILKDNTDQKLIPFMWENKAFLLSHFLGFGLLSILVNATAAWAPTYFIRIHGMEIKNIGLLLGLAGVPLGVSGVIVAGWMVDRAFKRGSQDIHFKHFAIRAVAIAFLGYIGFTFDSSLIFTIVCFGLIVFLQPFSGVAGASLQVSIPPVFRSRISAFFIMFYNAVGMMVGPSLVASLGTYFGPDKLGNAIALTYSLLGGTAAILLWMGREHAVRAVRRFSDVALDSNPAYTGKI